MDNHEQLYIEKIKEQIEQYISYETEENKRIGYLESQLPQFLLLKNDKITSAINKYYKDQEILGKKINEHQNEIQKHTLDIKKNIEDIYEMIRKL